MKKVIVACGSGVATSQTVASKVTRLLNERNQSHIKVEVINGIAFLTGMGMEQELQKVIDACK